MRNFTSPPLNISDYLYKIEMHAHTKHASYCGEIEPEELVEAYYKRGYDAVILTNHIRPNYTMQTVFEHVAVYDRAICAAQPLGMKIYFGVELTFSDLPCNDFLVYGVVPDDLTELYRCVQMGSSSITEAPIRNKCIIYTAHPYRDDRIGADCFVPEISDGVESFNLHPCVNSDNGFVSRFASEQGYLTICGTDYHHKYHEGMAALLVQQLPQNEAELVTLLRSGDYLFEFNENIVIPSHKMIKK